MVALSQSRKPGSVPGGQNGVLHARVLEGRHPAGDIKMLRVVDLGVTGLAELLPVNWFVLKQTKAPKR